MITKNKLALIVVAILAISGICYALFAKEYQTATAPPVATTVSPIQDTLNDQKNGSDPVPTSKKGLVPSVGYSTTKNINAYINSLNEAQTSPGTLDITQAKAWDECGSLIARPNSAELQIAQIQTDGGKYADFRIKALQQLQNRCKDFAFNTRLKRQDAEALYNVAAQKGNSEAIARGLVNNLPSMSADKAKQSVMNIVSSNDPAAIFTLADSFGADGPFEITPGGEVGTSNSTYAWQLVACDQGADCSATSVVVQQYCLGLGLCGPGDYRTNIQYSALSPSDYQQVTQAESNINAAISNGTVQKYFIHK